VVSPVLDDQRAIQETFMDEDMCIVVDEHDNIIGRDTKRNCHLMENINGNNLLHRAFSVFLFNEEGKLLLQQRAKSKITFPLMWTNTCCSHPLHNLEENNGVLGVKRAARRKLQHELGIDPEEVPLDKFQFLTKLHYKAASGDGPWGEHEVDYILIIQTEVKTINPNPGEVESTKYVDQNELRDLVQLSSSTVQEEAQIKLTPWFALIAKEWLVDWWNSLDDLSKFHDDVIHKL